MENAHTVIDSLLMADNEKTLARWKREEAYDEGLGTYISHLLKTQLNKYPYAKDVIDMLMNRFTEPTVPPYSDYEFWHDFARNTNKQSQVLEAQKYQEQQK